MTKNEFHCVILSNLCLYGMEMYDSDSTMDSKKTTKVRESARRITDSEWLSDSFKRAVFINSTDQHVY